MPRKKARTSPTPFTVETPTPLPVERDGDAWWMEAAGRRIRLSNLDKIFWPEEGYTKGDLLAYYWNVAPLILPYLADRPLTMKRMPEGIDGPDFYEKRAPSHTPEWMPRCEVPDEESGRPIDYLMAQDEAGLLFVANLGCIEFHPLHSRCGSVELPDYLFFDLDPFPPATFDDVLAVARHVRAAMDSLGLTAYPKTSGATGMQIYVGLEAGPTYEQVREFVGTVGRAIRKADPERVTMEWDVSKRSGQVFIDHNMNRRGANISAVYSVRPEPGGTVSTPLTWGEVEDGVLPQDFTIANIHERLAAVGDLFRPVLDDPADVQDVFRAIGLEADEGEPTPAEAPKTPRGKERPRGSERTEGVRSGPRASGGATSKPERGFEAAVRQLEEYGRKRDFGTTPEPPPAPTAGTGNGFVIQKHEATRLHYDLRLEHEGVLASWAVPRGLPLVPNDRRLAVHTEDHPLEYGGFEGIIPEGEYGAGEVRIFDSGTYELLEWKDDKVSFRLHGRRHQGEYHLIKTNRDWLVFLSKSSAEAQPDPPPQFVPMLAEPGHEAFDDPNWRFEPKLDGIRTLAYVATDGTRLISRRGRDQSGQYPELDNLARWTNALSAVIDGEIVAADRDGKPSFETLQQRMNLVSPRDIEKARRHIPVTLFAFDLLWLDGADLTGEPLEERRRRLDEIVTESERLALTRYIDGEGLALFDAARDLGFEGVIAKRLGSRYLSGRRSHDWRKIKALNRQDCVILGWTPGTGARSKAFGALLVGAYRDGDLTWIGQVGTGFTDGTLTSLMERLEPIAADAPPIDDRDLAAVKGARWVRPELVCDVEYLSMTKAGKLRAPSFKGLRPDKAPEDCLLEPPAEAATG